MNTSTCGQLESDRDRSGWHVLDEQHQLSERNREALRAARARCISVVAVTARTPPGLAVVPGLAAEIDFAICNNGAIWHDLAGGAIEVRLTIAVESVCELHRRARKALPTATFWAGRSCAMAGALPEAKAAAKSQTASYQEDGVAQAIEALFEATE
ncbi:HAD hydrolase family protein [Glycomyces sp. NPDC046736]|uniref:HAD family hydrolase n=1 Tax=Glycomyces sp. NPDC046736 TaxID=3155615 RepID=UPI0033F25E44